MNASKTAEKSDDELVKLTLEQGSQYFGPLVKRHSDYLFGLGMRLSGGRTELAKDMSQQAFIKAFNYLASFNSNHSGLGDIKAKRFRNWLTGIAVNCHTDLAKAEQKYVAMPEHSSNLEHAKSRFDQQALSDFSELLIPLTTEERQLITLRYVYEYSIAEIAGMLGLTEGTSKSKISRAIARLRLNSDAPVAE